MQNKFKNILIFEAEKLKGHEAKKSEVKREAKQRKRKVFLFCFVTVKRSEKEAKQFLIRITAKK